MSRIADLTKASRIILVLGIVKRLGRASPERIAQNLAAQSLMSSQDKNERRKLYRDLKELAESGELSVDYFAADGTRLESDTDLSETKFIRAEYFLPQAPLLISGEGLLESAGLRFRRAPTHAIQWSACELQAGLDPRARRNKTTLFIELVDERYICLQLPNDERPAKLLILGEAAGGYSAENRADDAKMQNLLGSRYGILYFKNRTVSRSVKDGRSGHAIISFLAEADRTQICDLGSTNGTQVAAAPEDFIEALRGHDAPLTAPIGSLRRVSQFRQIYGPAQDDKIYVGPLFLRFGGVSAFITSN